MLKVMKLEKSAILPKKAHNGDAGFDLFAVEDVIIYPNETKLVPTGIAVNIPYGYMGDITGKSGLTSKTSLRVQRGIVDYGYQGEVKVIVSNVQTYKFDDLIFDGLLNVCELSGLTANDLANEIKNGFIEADSDGIITIKKGQKIAQMILVPCVPDGDVVEVDSFEKSSERGEGGFGSTGLFDDKVKLDKISQDVLHGFIGG